MESTFVRIVSVLTARDPRVVAELNAAERARRRQSQLSRLRMMVTIMHREHE